LEKNPFLKDYGDNFIQALLDMTEVRNEVSKFLAERYGSRFDNVNMAIFLAVFTSENLLQIDISYNEYVQLLKLFYDFVKYCMKMGLVEFKRTP
jgi:transcription termination factor NusB